MHLRRRGPTLAAVALLIAATGCSNPSGAVGTGATSTPAPSSRSPASPSVGATSPESPSKKATPRTESEKAADAASALVRRYYALRDELRKDPSQSLRRLANAAISIELAAERDLFRRERRDGLHQTGDTKIAKLRVESVNLDNSDPEAGRVPTVLVDVCYDVSAVDILDSTGKSVVVEGRPDTGWVRYSVSNYRWRSNPETGWRVASGQDLRREACAAS